MTRAADCIQATLLQTAMPSTLEQSIDNATQQALTVVADKFADVCER